MLRFGHRITFEFPHWQAIAIGIILLRSRSQSWLIDLHARLASPFLVHQLSSLFILTFAGECAADDRCHMMLL